MTDPAGPIPGLSAIADRYDGLLCDVWGVVHNGTGAFAPAVEALVTYRRRGGRVVLVTNAPRPAPPLIERLDHFGVPREAYDGLISSGDVTRDLLKAYAGQTVDWVGPVKDESLFAGLGLSFGTPEDAAAVVVTDLDDHDAGLEAYDARLAAWRERGLTLVCANPDRVVEEGGRLIYCAGAIADLYAEIGGTVVMAGKPYAPIYERALDMLAEAAGHAIPRERLLAVGDSVRTDATGAARLGVPILFITGSVHAEELDAFGNPDPGAVADLVAPSGAELVGFMPRLVW